MKTLYSKLFSLILLFMLLFLVHKIALSTPDIYIINTEPKNFKTYLKEGDMYFKQYKLKEAINSYQEALKGSKDKKVYITRQIARTYKLLFDYENATLWYEKLMEFSSDISNQDIYEYAYLLKNVEQYDKAIEIYDLYVKKMQRPMTEAEAFIVSCKWAKKHLSDSSAYDIVLTNMPIAGVFLGAEFYNAGLMYGSIQNNTANNFSDLHYSKNTDSVTFANAEKIAGRSNSLVNDAHPSITSDGKTLYFTRNTTEVFYYNPKKNNVLEINSDGISLLNIYVSTNSDGEWSSPKRLSFNSKDFSCAYPFIDADGKTLYFSSNRPGGFGGFDIYKAILKNDSVFSDPENLGKYINSGDDDFAPRIYNNKLYYSSRGKGGFGGADIFVCDIEKNNKISLPVNLGVPFNSSKDDFYILFKKNNKEGYFASNRDGEHGQDKFYYFKKTPPAPDTLSGIVSDRITNAPLKDVNVNLYEVSEKGDSSFVTSAYTDDNGYWQFLISPEKKYITSFSLKDYYPRRFLVPVFSKINVTEKKGIISSLKEVKLSPVVKKNNIVKINNIYFDFNKANIRNDSYSILNNLIGFLKENPLAKIELSAHTDAAGNDKYNWKLSDNRAISCYEYLIANGISQTRIIPKGYGETKLLNNCKDAKKCSESENQLNRRVEVKFL